MNACIFAGPTLPPRDAGRSFEATWLPPAKEGDVYRAVTLLRPRAIGIVDGYFEWVPSVRHKEILWALHQGVHVFGAASMGALRAAEVAAYGMRGVGRIFEAYRDGRLAGCGPEPFEDDDEVAVVHGPAESGYASVSEAMVNIRCTLAAAERAGVIGRSTRERLVAIAKTAFYPDRSYELVLAHARAAGISEAELNTLDAWLPAGRVNQKRLDALAMLEAMLAFLAADPGLARAGFTFEHTSLWERAVAAVDTPEEHDAEDTLVLRELGLDGARGEELRAEVLKQAGQKIPAFLLERRMLERLTPAGHYTRLLERARAKEACFSARGGPPRAEALPELDQLLLQDWFFTRVKGSEIPDDLAAYLRESGYADETSFNAAIYAEYLFRQMTDGAEAGLGGTLPDSGTA